MKHKYRAWDKEANIMIYSDHRTRKLYDVYYGFEMNGQGELECRWEGEFTESHVLDGGIVDNLMQSTGFHDKNGKEIYRGDIVKCTNCADEVDERDSDTGVGIVEWLDKFGFWNVSNIENGLGDLIFNGYVEVIGNIYENPEFLEKKQWNEQMEHYKLNDFEQSKEKTKYIKFECISCKKQVVLTDRLKDGHQCRLCGNPMKAVGYVRRIK